MISHLIGTVSKHQPGCITVDVAGVGYRVTTPLDVWDGLLEDREAKIIISTIVREDSFALYGFSDDAGRTLFEHFIAMAGIGPKLGLELCSVPRALLLQAIGTQDATILSAVKGIGKKTAEKLLVDLKSLIEKQPELFGTCVTETETSTPFDQDAIAALQQLGYDTGTILKVLKDLPEDLGTTEDRVTAALRSL